MTTGLPRCGGCFYVVPDEDGVHGRCHRGEPVCLRGSERATWPQVELAKPGCGKFRHPGAPFPQAEAPR